jgi:proteasome lid subunit RPN8/RPN11
MSPTKTCPEKPVSKTTSRTTQKIPAPVVLNTEKEPLPWGLFPLGTRRRHKWFQTVVRQSALNNIHEHGLESPDVEVRGVLVGGAYRDDYGEFVYVRHIIRGKDAPATAASVTFTSETWTHLHEQLEDRHPDDRILGWYHTHPNHGISLSGMDKFIHESFFNLSWQVAYVHDPIRLEDGLFRWKRGSVRQTRFMIEADSRPTGALDPNFDRERERKLLAWLIAAMIALAIFSVTMVWAQVPDELKNDSMSASGVIEQEGER